MAGRDMDCGRESESVSLGPETTPATETSSVRVDIESHECLYEQRASLLHWQLLCI